MSTRFTDQTVSSKIEQNSLHKSQRNFELILFRKNTLQIGGSGQSALISLKRIQSKYGNFHEIALWGNIFSVRVNYFIINSIFFKISKIYLGIKFFIGELKVKKWFGYVSFKLYIHLAVNGNFFNQKCKRWSVMLAILVWISPLSLPFAYVLYIWFIHFEAFHKEHLSSFNEVHGYIRCRNYRHSIISKSTIIRNYLFLPVIYL